MAESLLPGDAPVSLNEARGWLRLGATVDDAVVAGLVRAATNICEAFIGQWLIVRAVEERLPIGAGIVRLSARPVVGIDGVALIAADGANGVPEAIRQGIVRMTQHLHDARDGAGAAPPAAIAALWQPWRRLTLGSGQ